MKLAGSLDKARAIQPGQHAKAADLHYDLEQELEHGLYSEDESDEAEQALAHLEAHHPGVKARSRAKTRPPKLSHSANRNIAGGGSGGATSSTPPKSGGGGAGGGSRSQGAGGSSPNRQGAGGTGRRRQTSSGRRVVERAAGVSSDSAADIIIGGLRWLLLAGIAYQVLQPGGSKAFGGVLGGVQAGFRTIVEPVDPFAPGAWSGPGGLRSVANAGGNPKTGIGTTDQRQFMRTPIHPLATGPLGSHVKQPSSPLAIGRNPLKIGG